MSQQSVGPVRTLPPLKPAAEARAERVVLDPWLEVMPVKQGERVPCLGTNARDLARALETAFGISIDRKGERVIRLRKKDGADLALRGMAALIGEGKSEANRGKEPFSMLLERLEQYGEIEVRSYGGERDTAGRDAPDEAGRSGR